jgi:hypothetical protein
MGMMKSLEKKMQEKVPEVYNYLTEKGVKYCYLLKNPA